MKFQFNIFAVLLVLLTADNAQGEEKKPFSIGGDFRFRHELIDEESRPQNNRERIRARILFSSHVNDDVAVSLQLASGSDDPISRNQTLGESFNSKQIHFDLACFAWNVPQVDGLTVTGGKFRNPFVSPEKTELIWDSDFNPEGLAAKYSTHRNNTEITAAVSYLTIQDSKKDDDAVIAGAQAAITQKLPCGSLLVGAGYYDYQNTRGNTLFYDSSDSFGNTVNAKTGYACDYNEAEILAVFSPSLFKSLAVFGDYVMNVASDVNNDTGWLAGLSFGSSSKPGSLAFRYSYRSLEKDAVVGAFTDSDFIGGGTEGSGHEVNIDYGLSKGVTGAVTYFFNKKGMDTEKDYHRLQVDMSFKL